jgi:hypothetical protein
MPSLIITCSKVCLIVLSLSAVISKLVMSYISFYGSTVLIELYYTAFAAYRCHISRPIIKDSLVS